MEQRPRKTIGYKPADNQPLYSIMNNIKLRDALFAGLIGGFLFLALQMVVQPALSSASAWKPLYMMASVLMGKSVLMGSLGFGWPLVVGLMVHLALSVVYAFVLANFVVEPSFPVALFISAAAGFVLYILNFRYLAPVMPWLSND